MCFAYTTTSTKQSVWVWHVLDLLIVSPQLCKVHSYARFPVTVYLYIIYSSSLTCLDAAFPSCWCKFLTSRSITYWKLEGNKLHEIEFDCSWKLTALDSVYIWVLYLSFTMKSTSLNIDMTANWIWATWLNISLLLSAGGFHNERLSVKPCDWCLKKFLSLSSRQVVLQIMILMLFLEAMMQANTY